MEPLHYARAQMGLSLAFHIVFAAAGIALPVLLVASDVLYRRTGDRDYLELSKRLAKGTAVLFAVGAVSGTVLSFELGLLWPRFMDTFGEVVGLPFALEGYAFFTEAIFLGIYLYGRDRVSPGLHLAAGIAVALSGAASAFFVTLVNEIMNQPRGFVWEGGRVLDVHPIAAMFGAPWIEQVAHVLISSYQSTAFAMAGIHAWALLRHGASGFHRKAFGLALGMACVTALVQPFSGDRSAKAVARYQPTKLAALEAQFRTERGAPLHIGGLPDEESQTVPYAIAIPGVLSFLAFGRLDAEVKGLDAAPRDEWPPVAPTHISFQVMVGSGVLMALLAVLAILLALRRSGVPTPRWFLLVMVAASPLGVIAMEAGWFVTELGRQPWVVRGVMRTAEAVTPFPYLPVPFWIFTVVYLFLAAAVVLLLRSQVAATVPARTREVAHARS
ncbi:MAG TPA: cytochrome ubiquinol oxidase subunit I [Myxococcaceae bacterium]|nr:cytochrome ubiquinol oxidase subunit I [Myxococcaceae bacterium]